MKLYKSPKDEIFAYESDGSQDDIIQADFAPITQDEADIIIKSNNEKRLNDRTDAEKMIAYEALRYRAYVTEADPLFFKVQRGEATHAEWLAKVEEIKARFTPDIVEV